MEVKVNPERATWAGVFRGLSPRTLEHGETLLLPDESPTRLFYLEAGRLRCAVVAESGATKTILYLWPGDLAGETNVLDRPGLVPLLVTSVGRSVVRSLGKVEARRLVALNPHLGEDLLCSLAAKTQAVIDQVRQMRFLSVEARVAEFLAKMHGRGGRAGTLEVAFTHEEIADFVGAHRVSVTEALRTMEALGAVETRRGRVILKDLELLRRAVTS